MISFIFNEAMRDLRRAGRVGVSAILLIALSLTALGGFWLLSLNLGRAIDQWGDRVRVVVYLKDEPPAAKLDELMQRIEAVGGIQRLRYISKSEALRALKRSLGSQADIADQLDRLSPQLNAGIANLNVSLTEIGDGLTSICGRKKYGDFVYGAAQRPSRGMGGKTR